MGHFNCLPKPMLLNTGFVHGRAVELQAHDPELGGIERFGVAGRRCASDIIGYLFFSSVTNCFSISMNLYFDA
jgi:hypothetical protein